MKRITVVIIALLFSSLGHSQDLIVTTAFDSIHCKINKVKKDHIYFVFKKENTYQSSLIEKSNIASYFLDFKPGYKIPKDSLPGYEKFPQHLFVISAGLSIDPGKRDPDFLPGFDEYVKDLRSGVNIGVGYSYFWSKRFGIGFLANHFSTNALEISVSGTDGNSNPVESDLSNEIRVLFIGPSFPIRFLSKTKKSAFIWNTSIGYIDYQDTYFYVEEIVTKGSGFGTVSTFGYNFGINNNLSFGIQLGLVTSYFKNITIETENSTTEMKLPDNQRPIASSRLDFSAGIRYTL